MHQAKVGPTWVVHIESPMWSTVQNHFTNFNITYECIGPFEMLCPSHIDLPRVYISLVQGTGDEGGGVIRLEHKLGSAQSQLINKLDYAQHKLHLLRG